MQPNDLPSTIAAAITSGLLWPSIGAVVLLAGLLLDHFRGAVAIKVQLLALWGASRRPLTVALVTLGTGLTTTMASDGPTAVQAVTGSITVFLILLGVRPIQPSPATSPDVSHTPASTTDPPS